MLRLSLPDASSLCPGPLVGRRELLRLGGFGLAGLAGLSPFAPLRAAHPPTTGPAGSGPAGFGRAKSVILVYCCGGQSQLETWDPKPEAPAEVRGALKPIATSVPGTYFGEYMPRIAKLAD